MLDAKAILRRMRASRGLLWLGLGLGLTVAYVLVLSFRPERPAHLDRVLEPTLAGLPKPHTIENPPRPEGELLPDPPEAPVDEPAVEPRDLVEERLQSLARVAEAPAVLTPEEQLQAIETLTQRAGVDPQDVIIDIQNRRVAERAQRRPLFSAEADPAAVTRQSMTAEPVAPDHLDGTTGAAKPKLFSWSPRRVAGRFPIGKTVIAELLTDVIAGATRTRALIRVSDSANGRVLGLGLVNTHLQPGSRDRVTLEGRTVIAADGRTVSGRFAAFSPDGTEGLVGHLRHHWLRHLGLRLYRTTLGVLALRVAEQGNTLAGIIGAQTGTGILKDLASENPQKGVPKTVFLPRGRRFTLIYLSPATLSDTPPEHDDPESHRLGRASDQMLGLRREQERRLLELSRELSALDGESSPTNRELSLDGVLNRPEAVATLLDGGGP